MYESNNWIILLYYIDTYMHAVFGIVEKDINFFWLLKEAIGHVKIRRIGKKLQKIIFFSHHSTYIPTCSMFRIFMWLYCSDSSRCCLTLLFEYILRIWTRRKLYRYLYFFMDRLSTTRAVNLFCERVDMNKGFIHSLEKRQ